MRYRRILAMLLAVSAPAAPRSASGQGVRGTATSMARYIEFRPIRRDSVPIGSVQREPDGTYTFDGSPITCIEGLPYCARYVAADVEHAIAFTQDVGFTVWGLGMRGLSATVLFRARVDAGGFAWPRSDDAFDAMMAYAELDRGTWRVRAGRQRTTGGLGFSGYDGVSASLQPRARIELEGFAGRSLARGLDEPRNEALRGLESFLPDRDAWILGGAVHVEPAAAVVLTARYQREIWSDRSGLVSERAALDARASLPGRATLGASADYDFAFGRIGSARTMLSAPLADGAINVDATVRRYVPYFELWTIWGFFDPAAWHETELRASWRAGPNLSLRLRGGWRWYDDTNTTVVLSELPDRAKRAGVGANLRIGDRWSFDGDYAIETGFGAFLSTGTIQARWQVADALGIGINGIAFQQIEEFRIGEGAVIGGGVTASFELGSRTGIDAGASVYRQTFDGRANMPDWNQFRGFASLRVGFGRDPGMRGVVR